MTKVTIIKTVKIDCARRTVLKVGRTYHGCEMRGPIENLAAAAEVTTTSAGPWNHKADAIAWADSLHREEIMDWAD